MRKTRVLAAVVVVGGAVFGAMGGEYSTIDWWTITRSLETEEAALERLTREVDSLGALAEALETDPATQEREAREAFGMIKPGEMLYRVEQSEP